MAEKQLLRNPSELTQVHREMDELSPPLDQSPPVDGMKPLGVVEPDRELEFGQTGRH